MISDFMGIDMITGPTHASYAYLIEQSVGAGVDMVRWPEYMITKKLIKLYFVLVGCGFLLYIYCRSWLETTTKNSSTG